MRILIVSGKIIKVGDSILLYFSEVARFPRLGDFKSSYRDFRTGDVRHSLADVSKAQSLLGYAPTHRINEGLREAWIGIW